MASIEGLKAQLGAMGRADFETTWPADLSWPRERLAVFVMDCLPFGCKVHARDANQRWGIRIQTNLGRARKRDAELTRLGWRVYRVYDCEAREKPRKIALKVCEKLAELGGAEEDIASARSIVAIRDMELRVGMENVLRLLRLISSLGWTFQKILVEEMLVYQEKWSKTRFKMLWKACLHHRVIRSDYNGSHPGPLYTDVMRALKIAPDRRITQAVKRAKRRIRRQVTAAQRTRSVVEVPASTWPPA